MFTRRNALSLGALTLLQKCPGLRDLMGSARYRSEWGRPNPTSRTYRTGPYEITLGTPRQIAIATPGQYAHFPGVAVYPTGEILLHYPTIPDTDQVPGISRYVISTDKGRVFDDALNGYFVDGNHTSAEPLALCADGVLRGGTFDPRQYTHPGGDLRKIRMPLQEVSNGGRTTVLTPDAVTINGFPADIGEFSPGVIGCSWFGTIVKYSDTHWVSAVLPKFVGQTRIWPQCIETFDRLNWNIIGQIAGDFSDEGLSEGTMVRVPSGTYANRLIYFSRVGIGPIARSYSDDAGHTWTLITTSNQHPLETHGVNAWCKAPFVGILSSGDFMITTGYVGPTSSEPWVQGLAPAQMGIYVSQDPMANGWPRVDILVHHNTMMPASLNYDARNQPTGYSGWVEPDPTAPNHVLVVYDQDYTTNGRPNRIFAVDGYINRVA